MHSEREHYTPTFCMHHCINTGQLTVITAVFPARQLQPAASLHQTQTADRGSQEVGGEAFWKPGQNQTQRVGEELPGARGGRSQTSNTKPPPPLGTNKLLDRHEEDFGDLRLIDANFALKSYQEARQHYIT